MSCFTKNDESDTEIREDIKKKKKKILIKKKIQAQKINIKRKMREYIVMVDIKERGGRIYKNKKSY